MRWYFELLGYVITGLFILYAISHGMQRVKDNWRLEDDMRKVGEEQGCEYLGRVNGVDRVVLFACKGKVVANLLGEKL